MTASSLPFPLSWLPRPLAALLAPLLSRNLLPRVAPSLIINPAYADLLRGAGLVAVEDFLALPETIVSGHPNRQVSRVTLGAGPDAVTAFLKKEHRVPWKERLVNALAGFGFASKSWREARMLEAVRPVFPGCPEWIAAGEGGGRAFLLVREVPGTTDLRRFLESRRDAPPAWRRRFARRLGATLARLHAAGLAHGDLYTNHVLIDPETEEVVLVDWQRASRPLRPGRRRWRDLAALAATLPDGLASPRDRLACLRAYAAWTALSPGEARRLLRQAVSRVRGIGARLGRRRHVRAKRLPPLPLGRQSLICLEGDNALCVTSAFLELWPSGVPQWLVSAPAGRTTAEDVPLHGGGRGRLVRARHRLPWLARVGRLRSRWTSPERRQMSVLNRLQRYGIEAPQVLAVGERPAGDGCVHAFLLTRPPAETVPLERWLSGTAGRLLTPKERRQRREVLRQVGGLLARLHGAGCYGVGPCELAGFAVRPSAGGVPALVIRDASGLLTRPHHPNLAFRLLGPGWPRRRPLRAPLFFRRLSRTDRLRVVRGYLAAAPERPTWLNRKAIFQLVCTCYRRPEDGER